MIDWPDLQELVAKYGAFSRIPAEGWKAFYKAHEDCQRELRRGLPGKAT